MANRVVIARGPRDEGGVDVPLKGEHQGQHSTSLHLHWGAGYANLHIQLVKSDLGIVLMLTVSLF